MCPVCTSLSDGRVEKYRGNHPVFDNISVIECRECGTWSAFPILPQDCLSVLYEKDYWTKEIYEKRLPFLDAQMVSRCEYLKSVKDFNGDLKILDIGASVGVMNRVAGKCFGNCKVHYSAVEVNPAALNFLGINCDREKIFKSLDDTPGNYDLIILSHILEHISSPKTFLNNILAKLGEGGIIFVEVPNCDFRFKKFHQPHMIFYNINSLKIVIELAGLKCQRVDTCGRQVRQMQIEANLARYSLIEKMGLFLSRRLDHFINKESPDPAFSELVSYGGDRRWLRLIAEKNL